MPASPIGLRCRCGAVRGRITDDPRKHGIHVVCYCSDCRAFANEVDSRGNGGAPVTLDAWGGTHIVQLYPDQVQVTEGNEHLRCLKLTPKGAIRWYAACCHTPMANTVSASLPFVGLLHTVVEVGESGEHAVGANAADGAGARSAQLERCLGKVRARVQGQDALGDPPYKIAPAFPAPVVAKLAARIAWGKLRGRAVPSPFFKDGSPVSKPERFDRDRTLLP